ncbi:PIG-L deacetylase family protein [Nocardiopsis synnemataformans]|uniref:PIG-L deacetylase family protein n=1 Tax=Nocardiopsis synnemataformans TaxID=61305 RepID=UPI003EBD0D8D
MTSSERVLAVAAHADDEIIGAGGTLAMHAAAGHALCILILSSTATSRPGADHTRVGRHRAECARKVADLYGAELHLGTLPDNRFDTVERLSIVQQIEEVVGQWRPTRVYSHSTADLSMDHQITAHCTATATRPLPGASVRTLLAWEIRSATEWAATPFAPTWFQPLSPAAQHLKEQALHIYDSEMRPWPHPRSHQGIHVHAQARGTQIGHEAAEAFTLVRHVQPQEE